MSRRDTYYKIKVHHVGSKFNYSHLEDEIDAFWVFGPKVVSERHTGAAEGEGAWYVIVQAESGFGDAWEEENQVRAKTTVTAGDSIEAVQGEPA